MDNVSAETRRKTMQAVKSKNTKLEELVMKALWNRNIRYRKYVRDLPGNPDIAIKSKKIVIFIDSCFWHGCSEHCRMPNTNQSYWQKKISSNRTRDERANSYYVDSGWTCIRVWEHELQGNFDLVISKLESTIRQSRN